MNPAQVGTGAVKGGIMENIYIEREKIGGELREKKGTDEDSNSSNEERRINIYVL